MRSRGRLAVVATAVLAAGPAVPTTPAAPAAPAAPAPGVTVETVHSGLDHPWDLAFLPAIGDPAGAADFLVTERSGAIDLSSGGTLRELAAPEDVVARSEGGMMGVAVDPDFATNRRVYTCFLSDRSGALDVRIARWTLDPAAGTLTERQDILTGLPVNRDGEEGRHSGCRPRFGPDGHLWVGTGDAATGTNAQDPESLGGKVLRITTDGAAAPGNAGAPFRPEIYTYGHRNVQGLAFDSSGQAYAVEHGTERDDELNRLEVGANYGWDPAGDGSGYDESRPMTDREAFPDARPAVWSSGEPTIAPSGATFLSGPSWGSWDGALVMAVLKDRQLRVLALDGGRTAVAEQWADVEDQGRLRTAVQAPDGSLYVATDADDGRILRITPAAAPAAGG